MPRVKLDGRTVNAIKKDLQKGLAVGAIASKRNVSPYLVKKYMEEAKPAKKRRGRKPAVVVEATKSGRGKFDHEKQLDICRDYLDKRNAAATAKRFKTTNQTVLKIIKTHGITTGRTPRTRKIRGRRPRVEATDAGSCACTAQTCVEPVAMFTAPSEEALPSGTFADDCE